MPLGEAEYLGEVDISALGAAGSRFDSRGTGWIYAKGNAIYYRSLPLSNNEAAVVIGQHDNDASITTLDEKGRLWSRDRVTGEHRCWSLEHPRPYPLAVIPPLSEIIEGRMAVRDRSGRWLCLGRSGHKPPLLWNLGGLQGARRMRLTRREDWSGSIMDIDPDGRWLTASAGNFDRLIFWPIGKAYPSVVDGYASMIHPLAFSPDGEILASGWGDNRLRLWPLSISDTRDPKASEFSYRYLGEAVFDSTGETFAAVGFGNEIHVQRVHGGSSKRLEGFSGEHVIWSAAFSPNGRFFAAASGYCATERKVLRVWDLETEKARVFDLETSPIDTEMSAYDQDAPTGWEHGVQTVFFADESTLYTAGWGGVHKWNLESGRSESVVACEPQQMMLMKMTVDQQILATGTMRIDPGLSYGGVTVHDLSAGLSHALEQYGESVFDFDIDPSGKVIATGDINGIVRVGRLDADDPHLLLGHSGVVDGVAISPQLDWVATAGQDETIRLWPMPDLSKPPLHTLPQKELIAKLETLTNLRVVRDEESATGWKVEIGPFPGWATVPEW